MGTGKTAAGRALAEMLGVAFVDMDQLIEEREGLSVSDIFATKGEAHFRRCEKELCRSLADQTDLVVATGGGALVDPRNLEALSTKGRVFLLEASVDAIMQRVGDDRSRPLLTGDETSPGGNHGLADRIRMILAEREQAYSEIPSRVDTTRLSPRGAACRIAAEIPIPDRTITLGVPLGSMGTDRSESTIMIGRGLLSRLDEKIEAVLGESGRRSRVFVMIPATVRDLHIEQVAAALAAASIDWTEIPIHDGDKEKTFDQAGRILDALARSGAARDSIAITMGGGVTGDLGGFAASIYMRGMTFVQVPTTLLAQVDASIGGKVGVNHVRAKNLVGNFYQPHLVLSDPCVLRTLDDGEISNGMAEVVKTALLGSADLFHYIEKELETSTDSLRRTAFLERCVFECAAIKASIVERDPFEEGERRVLNLGHTLGHAFETLGEYGSLTHGQAVSIGLVAVSKISRNRDLVDENYVRRVAATLERCGLPITPPAVDWKAFLDALNLDKKKRSGRLHFVLPTGLGATTIVDDVTIDEIEKAANPAPP